MTATYTKLRDGSWGIRAPGKITAGTSVEVHKKSGQTKRERVGKVLWTGRDNRTGAIIALCTIDKGQTGSALSWRERERHGDRYMGTSLDGQYCGYPCPVTGRKCNPKNGPCHDCA